MEGDIDKHTFGAGMGSQEPSEFVDRLATFGRLPDADAA
jgi:hypothetical protein